MKKWLKNITGITAKEKALEDKELEVVKVKDPKAYATRKKEPWVNVLDMQVNGDNIRNGFFELDWNKYFIQELIENGYGEESDPEEEIVDRWFRDIVYNMLQEEAVDSKVNTGYINVVPIDKGKSEVS
ncbi:hypothetical protein N9993_00750 [bacterium]|jgi:hypothetical protein|nr:hypothetical protein [bacterium]